MHYEKDNVNTSPRNKCLDCENFNYDKSCKLGFPIDITKRMISCDGYKCKYEKQRNKTI